MTNGLVRKIIDAFVIEREGCLFSKDFCEKLTHLFDELDDDEVNFALINSINTIITDFWRKACEEDVPDWQANPFISPWLKLASDLREMGCKPDAHHRYFYQHFQREYDQSGDGKISAGLFIGVIKSCCRMIGYADRFALEGYPLSKLEQQITRAEQLKQSHTLDVCKARVTALSVIFYIFYHHCSERQREILPHLLHYRTPTTDEERRSEKALIRTLVNNAQAVSFFFVQRSNYVEGRELNENHSLQALKRLIPASKAALLTAILGKFWHQISGNITSKPDNLTEAFIKTLTGNFELQNDKSYSGALSFAAQVIHQSEGMSLSIVSNLLSALYIFCLQRYIDLRKSEPATESLWQFSSSTKCNAARKLQLGEMGAAVALSTKEFLACNEGRLKELREKFDDYKESRVLASTSEISLGSSPTV
jgi:hypothetical protein